MPQGDLVDSLRGRGGPGGSVALKRPSLMCLWTQYRHSLMKGPMVLLAGSPKVGCSVETP